MVRCPFCHESFISESELQLHFVAGCPTSVTEEHDNTESVFPSETGMVEELVETKLRWIDKHAVSEPEIFLISSLDGSIPLFRKGSVANIYESDTQVLQVGVHQCQLVIGDNICPTKNVDIDPLSTIVDIVLDESGPSVNPMDGDRTPLNETTSDFVSDEATSQFDASADVTLSPLYNELVAHQVAHGEPNWVPIDDNQPMSSDTPLFHGDEDFIEESGLLPIDSLAVNGHNSLFLRDRDTSNDRKEFPRGSSIHSDVSNFREDIQSTISASPSVNVEPLNVEGRPGHCERDSPTFLPDIISVSESGASHFPIATSAGSDDKSTEPPTVYATEADRTIPRFTERAHLKNNGRFLTHEEMYSKLHSYESEVEQLRKDNQELLRSLLQQRRPTSEIEKSKLIELEDELKATMDLNRKLTEENESIRTAHLLREEDLQKMNRDLEDEIQVFRVKFKDLESKIETENRAILRENAHLKDQNKSMERKIGSLMNENARLLETVETLRDETTLPHHDKCQFRTLKNGKLQSEIPGNDSELSLEDLGTSSDESALSTSPKFLRSKYAYEKYVNGAAGNTVDHRVSENGLEFDSKTRQYSRESSKSPDFNGNFVSGYGLSAERKTSKYTDKSDTTDYPAIRKSLLCSPFESQLHSSRKSGDETMHSGLTKKTRELFKSYKSKTYQPREMQSSATNSLITSDLSDQGDGGILPSYSSKVRRERPHSYHEGGPLSIKSVFKDELSLLTTPKTPDRSYLSQTRSGKTSRSYSSGIDNLGREPADEFSRWSLSKQRLKPFAPTSPSSVKVGMPINVTRSKGGVARGVVKWKGYLPGHKEFYVGVELNSPTGLNDGAVGGIRYFQCAPGYGLFVTYSKILMLWDYESLES